MDIEIIIAIIIWIGIIAFSKFSSDKKKTEGKHLVSNPRQKEAFKSGNITFPELKQYLLDFADTTPAQVAEPTTVIVDSPTPLLEEGERVIASADDKTTSRDIFSTVFTDNSPIVKKTKIDRLNNRENLRKAIIYGEILRPKFDY